MKKKLTIIILILSLATTLEAQKSSYIVGRYSITTSFDMRWRNGITGSHATYTIRPSFLLRANYGVLKFLETGLYYYFTDDKLSFYNDFGLSNRFHILPFVTKTDSKFFRFDCYVVNNYGISLATNYNDRLETVNGEIINMNHAFERKTYSTFYIDAGVGASFFFTKHVGLNLEYCFKFPLKRNRKVLDALSLGIIVKF